MEKQPWFCLKCDQGGVVLYDQDRGAYDVINRIRRAHDDECFDHGISCDGDPRVVNLNFNTTYSKAPLTGAGRSD